MACYHYINAEATQEHHLQQRMVQEPFILNEAWANQPLLSQDPESQAVSPLQQVTGFLVRTLKDFQASLPHVNKDHKYYTPSFILEDEREFYYDNDNKMLKNHEEKM